MGAFFAGGKGVSRLTAGCVVDCERWGGEVVDPADKILQILDL